MLLGCVLLLFVSIEQIDSTSFLAGANKQNHYLIKLLVTTVSPTHFGRKSGKWYVSFFLF